MIVNDDLTHPNFMFKALAMKTNRIIYIVLIEKKQNIGKRHRIRVRVYCML